MVQTQRRLPQVWNGQVGLNIFRVIVAAVGALASGLGVAIGVNRLVYGAPTYGYGSMEILLRFWGLAVGSVVAVIVARVVLGIRLEPKGSRRLQIASAAVLAVLSLVTFLFGAGLGFPTPLSPEGVWFYPAVATPLVAAYLLFRNTHYRRKCPFSKDTPERRSIRSTGTHEGNVK